MYEPKISRIRPTGRSRNGRIVRYIFLGIIALAILIGGGMRIAKAAPGDPLFDNPMAQYLHEEGVSFILRNDSILLILRSETPEGSGNFAFPDGYTNPQAVCQRLRSVGMPSKVILFDVTNPQEAACN